MQCLLNEGEFLGPILGCEHFFVLKKYENDKLLSWNTRVELFLLNGVSIVLVW